MAVSKRTRYEVLKRDNHTCRYCHAADQPLTVDHVTPVALGGSDDPSNLVAACKDCNAGKSSSNPDASLVEDVKQDALRWAAAIAKAAELLSSDTEERYRLNGEVQELWEKLCVGYGGKVWYRPADWAETLDMFRSRGLPQPEILDAFWIMQGKDGIVTPDRWRYFCGICWRKLDRIHEAAKAIIEVTDG